MNTARKYFHKIPHVLRTKKSLVVYVSLLIGFFILTSGSADKGKIETASVEKDTIVSEVIASGKVTSPSSATLRFGVPGRVVSVGVNEGETIDKGTFIASINAEKYQIALREAEWNFQAAKAEFDKVYDDLRGNTDETFDERIRRTAVDQLHNNAYEELLKARSNIRDTAVYSPIGGTVVDVGIKIGEEAQITTTVASIVDLSNLQFTAEIDETDIGLVEADQDVTIILDAFPDKKLRSTISNVSLSSVQTSTGATAYEVDFGLPLDSRYRLGMNGEVNIITDKAQNVLVIPLESVLDEKYVWVERNGWYEKKEIQLGILSDLSAEVTKGLEEGDKIVVSGFDEIEKKSLLDRIIRR